MKCEEGLCSENNAVVRRRTGIQKSSYAAIWPVDEEKEAYLRSLLLSVMRREPHYDSAFETLWHGESFEKRVFHFLLGLTASRDAAIALTHEVAVALFLQSRYDECRTVAPYVMGIAHNMFRKWRQERFGKRKTVSIQDIPEPKAGDKGLSEDDSLRERFQEQRACLTNEERTILDHKLSNVATEDTAHTLGVTQKAVYYLRSRLTKRLKLQMRAEDVADDNRRTIQDVARDDRNRRCLSPLQSKVILRWLDGASYTEIANELQIAPRVVLQAFLEGVQRIMRFLGESDD